jgi:hypothetical protein
LRFTVLRSIKQTKSRNGVEVSYFKTVYEPNNFRPLYLFYNKDTYEITIAIFGLLLITFDQSVDSSRGLLSCDAM